MVGQKEKKKKKSKRLGEKRRVGRREERRERDTFKSTPAARCGNWDKVTAVKQASDVAGLTSLGSEVIVAFETFCRFSSKNKK